MIFLFDLIVLLSVYDKQFIFNVLCRQNMQLRIIQ